jgi:hypothetical protein
VCFNSLLIFRRKWYHNPEEFLSIIDFKDVNYGLGVVYEAVHLLLQMTLLFFLAQKDPQHGVCLMVGNDSHPRCHQPHSRLGGGLMIPHDENL